MADGIYCQLNITELNEENCTDYIFLHVGKFIHV